jgi:phage terminase small subunit
LPRHYVYALIDPRNLQPFYIGKGSSERRFSHFKNLPRDLEKSGDKAKTIAEIKASGAKPEAIVLSWHDSDAAAYDAEQRRIKAVGLDKLTNQNAGGAGDRTKPSTKANEVRLTSKEEAFCQAFVSGLNQTDAYRKAYAPSSTAKPQTVNRASKTIMDKCKIRTRIAELRKPLEKKAEKTVMSQINRLDEMIEQAMETDQVSAAMKGIELQSKLLDQFPATKNINENHDMNELDKRLQEARERLAGQRVQLKVIDGKRRA